MAIWLVQLEGEAIDLEEFPARFAAGPMCAMKEGDAFYISGEALEQFRSASEVRDAARAFVDEASAVIAILWPAFRKPIIGSVYRHHEDGRRDVCVFPEGAELRIKAGEVAVAVNGKTVQPVPVATLILGAARSNPHLHRALLLWSDRPRSWHRLSVVIEELQHFFGGSPATAGLCSDTELERFNHTANNAEAAGLDARHALHPHRKPPKNPMTLAEAETFVRGVLEASLRRAAGL